MSLGGARDPSWQQGIREGAKDQAWGPPHPLTACSHWPPFGAKESLLDSCDVTMQLFLSVWHLRRGGEGGLPAPCGQVGNVRWVRILALESKSRLQHSVAVALDQRPNFPVPPLHGFAASSDKE